MRWNKVSLKSSLQSLLGPKSSPDKLGSAGTGRQADAKRLDAIRTAMIAELDRVEATDFEHVAKRIILAKSIEALWFLRADLMHALSSILGEADARQRMQRITQMFDGLLSAGLNSRPSPLGNRSETP